MRVAVIGATGALGRHLVPRLRERGHEVRAGLRTERHTGALRQLGVECVRADILDAGSLDAVVSHCDAALHIATSIPKPGGSGDWALNDRIRRDGTRHLLEACRRGGVPRYLQQSVAMLHAAGDSLQTENEPLAPSDRLRSAVEMEGLVAESALDWRIVRGGAFYGPGTSREQQWRAMLAAGTLKLPGDGGAYISLIHAADMASAMLAVLESESSRQTYIAADDEPVTYRTLFAHIAALAGAAAPAPGGPVLLGSFRVSNAKLRRLGWAPAYPTFRSGLAVSALG